MKIKRCAIFIFAFFVLLTLEAQAASDENWQEYRGQHFIIYYRDTPQDFLKSVEEMAEYYYQEITRNLGFYRSNLWVWDKRAKIYIYRDSEDYVESSQQSRWSHGAASAPDKTIRTFPTAHGFFDSTLPHELGHIIFREFVGYKSSIPLWVDEGVAMYQEKARRWGAHETVKRAIEDKSFIPLQELSQLELTNESSQELVELFYMEAASVMYYLINEEGDFKFASFCRHLRDGEGFNMSLKKAYYRIKDAEDLNKAWLNYLTR